MIRIISIVSLLVLVSACGNKGIHLEAPQEQYLHFKEIERKTNILINSECFRNGVLAKTFDFDQGEDSRIDESSSDVLEAYREANITALVQIVPEPKDFWARTDGETIEYLTSLVSINDGLKFITAVTIHEMAHILGYDHDESNPIKYNNSVPVAASSIAMGCLVNEAI